MGNIKKQYEHKDFQGRKVHVGDTVLIASNYRTLEKVRITRITKKLLFLEHTTCDFAPENRRYSRDVLLLSENQHD